MIAGVPQGSIVSPMLYNLYTFDIPKSIASELAVYADELCIYEKTKNSKFTYLSVQHHLKLIGYWADKLLNKINADKTTAVVFTRRSTPEVPRLELHAVFTE